MAYRLLCFQRQQLHANGVNVMRIIVQLPRLFYTLISIVLLGIALMLIGFGLWEVWLAMHSGSSGVVDELLNAIGVIVISMALMDVAMFLLEEGVVRNKAINDSVYEIRRSLTKFVSIIIIAVCMEALVFIFKAGKTGDSSLMYPTLLLLAGVAMIAGLGLFMRWTSLPGGRPRNGRRDP